MSIARLPLDCVGHKGNVVHLAYSKVCESGYYLASACRDGQAILRHGDTGDWVGTLERNSEAMLYVDINDDATRLATGSEDCTARTWNAVDGEQLSKILLSSPVRCVAFSSTTEYLAVGCLDRKNGHVSDETLFIYNMVNEDMPTIFEGLTRGVRDLLFCRDDRALLSSSHDRSVRLWDRLTGAQAHSILLPHHAKSIELGPDGVTLTIAYSHSVTFIDVDRFMVLKCYKFPVRIVGASLHPEKVTFVCAGSNHYIYKCDYATGEILESFLAHDFNIRSIKYSPDGEVFASSSDKGELRLWQQTVGKKYALWGKNPEKSGGEDEPMEESESLESSTNT